jgi:hypothetical protein
MNSDSQEPRPLGATTEHDDEMDQSDDEMEIPYTQNLGIVSDSLLALEMSGSKTEPLRAATWRGTPSLWRETQRGTYKSETKPYLTMPWKHVKQKDLDEAHTGQQSILSNLKFLCEMLDGTAAAAIFKKLPRYSLSSRSSDGIQIRKRASSSARYLNYCR